MSTGYADQRGHDVALIIAPDAARAQCGTCGGTILRVAAEPWERAKLRLPAWVHAAGTQNHTATLAVTVTRVYRSGLPTQHAATVRYADGLGATVTLSNGRVSWADAGVWADPGAYSLAPWYCPGHNGGVCQYGACDYIRWTGPDLAGLAGAFETREATHTADQHAAQSAARLARYARGDVGYRLLG